MRALWECCPHRSSEEMRYELRIVIKAAETPWSGHT